jgi:hypothetical protein
LLGVGAVETDDDGRLDVDASQCLDDAVGHLLAAGDAAEDVDEDGLDLVVGVDDLEGSGHDVGVGAAADVQEVGRPAAHLVDHVAGTHGQARPVGDDPDRAVETDVLEVLRLGQPLAFVEFFGAGEVGPLGMTEGGVVVEADLGVEGVHPTVRREDQRVDLGQVAVTVHVAAVELEQNVDGPVLGGRIEIALRHPGPAAILAQPVDGVDGQAGDGFWAVLGDLFDLHAARGAQHAEVELGAPVEGETGVVLLGDVAGVFDPHPAHDVTLDVHAQDVAGVHADGVGVRRELDPARLAPAPDLDLGLDHHRVPDPFGHGQRLPDGLGHPARGHGDAVAGEVLLALVLEQVHSRESSRSDGQDPWPSRPERWPSRPAAGKFKDGADQPLSGSSLPDSLESRACSNQAAMASSDAPGVNT